MQMQIATIDDEVETRVWCYLKSCMVAAGLLEPILCEDELAECVLWSGPANGFKVDKALLRGPQKMRKAANALLDREAANDGEAVKVVFVYMIISIG